MKKFFGKFFLLIPVVFLLQMLVGKFEVEFSEMGQLKGYLEKGTDILYLGDCTDSTLSKADRDTRSISRMLQDLIPHRRIDSIAHMAYQLDIYLEYCRYLVKQAHPPRVVIIPVNIRSFSPQWDMMPHYQFEKERIILRGGIGRRLLEAFYGPLRAFHYNFYSIGREEYLNAPVFDGKQQVGKVKDFEIKAGSKVSEETLGKKILLNYMFSLETRHRKVRSMLEIAGVLSGRGIGLVFYITPIDIETGERYFPNRFTRQLERNTKLIKEVLAGKELQLLDLSTGLGADGFSWKDRVYPSEQLNQKGRYYVAGKISECLRSIGRKPGKKEKTIEIERKNYTGQTS